MAESIHTQVVDALVDSLEGIVGDGGTTYWDTPGAVVASDWFEDALLDPTITGPIYAIKADQEEHNEGETGGTIGRVSAEMDIFILCLRTFPWVTEDLPDKPFAQRELPMRKVVDRMVQDVLQKLLVDVRLVSVGGAVDNLFANPVIVDRDRALVNWAAAEISFRASYRYEGRP